MNRKTVLLPVVVGLVLLAIYGIWLYNPLKLLAPSENQSRQTPVAGFGAGNLPVIIKKKIPPHSEPTVQQSDVPRPLIVLQEMTAKDTAQSVEPNQTAQNRDLEGDQPLVLQPDGQLTAEKSAAESAAPDAVLKSVAPQAEAVSAEPQSPLPYSILLSSCRLPQSARKIVAEQQKAGLSPYVVKVKYENGDVWLRVLAGQYPTRNEALRIKKIHHLSDAIVKKTPYANLVGSFATAHESKDSLKRLKDSGYSAYVIKRAENRFQVVVGAFITREGAEKQKLELQSKGIPNEIIER
jgi:cell division septation protein DedD